MILPSRVVVVAGTYDGVLAGWDTEVHKSSTEDDEEKNKDDNNEESESSSDDNEDEPSNKKQRKNNRKDRKKINRKKLDLKMSFAMAAHDGSVRCLSIGAHTTNKNKNKTIRPSMLMSGGFDEVIRLFDLHKHSEAGETKTPSDMGTPTCSSFAPPFSNSTHCLIGLTSGNILLYKRKDWSIVHVLGGGHTPPNSQQHQNYSNQQGRGKGDFTTHLSDTWGGVSCIAVHPSGKMALSGGVCDGKLCLWDLVKGRLAFVHKIPSTGKKARKEQINQIAWSFDGTKYAYCYGNHVTARDAMSGEGDEALLDIELPSRVNQLCFLNGGESNGLYFLACACNDGSLPVLQVSQDKEEKGVVRAVMAIEPVDLTETGVVGAGEDRFKCIQAFGDGFLVATANSGGIISIMDLSGAVQMILDEDEESSSDNEDDDDDDLVAVEILQSVRVGSGARVTNIACWSSGDLLEKQKEFLESSEQDDDEEYSGDEDEDIIGDIDTKDKNDSSSDDEEEKESIKKVSKEEKTNGNDKKRKANSHPYPKKKNKVDEMDEGEIEKARDLVQQAKKRQKKKEKKKKKKKQQKES